MEFIRRHSGPFGLLHGASSGVTGKADLAMKLAGPDILDYLEEKAKELDTFLKDKWLDEYQASMKELYRVLELIKKSGVEVINE